MQGVEGLLAEMKAMRQRVEALEKRVTDLEAENAALRTENAALRAENTALRKALDEERRAGKRQASPFSRGIRKANPKKPGRKPGGPRSLEVPPTEGCANYIGEIKAVLQKALALRDRRHQNRISNHGLRVSRGRLEAKLNRLLDEPDLHDESIRFAMHLLNNRDAILLFLRRPDVDATNFRAEQAIRPAVINRKTSGGNRTDRGANAQAILMSILRTCKQRSLDAMSVFTQILRSPTPVAHSLGR